jgi:hypothetical protein
MRNFGKLHPKEAFGTKNNIFLTKKQLTMHSFCGCDMVM